MNNFSCSQAKLVLYNNAPCWLLDQWSCLTIRHPFGTDNDRASIVFWYWQSSFRSNLLLAGQWNYICRISRIWSTLYAWESCSNCRYRVVPTSRVQFI